jgi:putative hydrolase of the HAD superfamily
MSLKVDIGALLTPMEPYPTAMAAGGRLAPPIRAVVFDIYGTLLISSSGDIGTAADPVSPTDQRLRELASRYGVSLPPDRLRESVSRAITDTHRIRKAAGTRYPEVDIVDIWQSILGWKDRSSLCSFALEYEMTVNPVFPMPGCRELLNAINSASLPMGVVSNAQFYTQPVVEAAIGIGLEDLGFRRDLMIFSYQLTVAKPSRILFERCADALSLDGIRPREAVYMGNDMLNDMLPAAQIGFQTVLFAGDARSLRLRESNDKCRRIRPDAVITSLDQLPPLTGINPS